MVDTVQYDFLASYFIYNEMNKIRVGLLWNSSSCIQFSNAPRGTGTDPLVLNSIDQFNYLDYNTFTSIECRHDTINS